jgi:hypothetical protein
MTPSEPFNQIDSNGGYKVVKKKTMHGWAQDIAIFDTIAYITQGQSGLAIMSINNIQNPVLLSEVGSDIGGVDVIRGYAYTVTTKQCIAYIGCGSFGLSVVNACDDPYHPVQVVTNSDPKPAKNMAVYKKLLITANSERGFDVASIAQPTAPNTRGSRRTPGFCEDVCISNDSTILLTACGEGGLAFYPLDVFAGGTFSDTGDEFQACTLFSHIDLPGYAKNVCTNNLTAFIACKNAGLKIVDYSSKFAPKVISTLEAKSSIDFLCVKENMVYMIDGKQFVAVDVTNPALPREVGRLQLTYPSGIATYKDAVLVADKYDGLVIIQRTGVR